MDLDSDSKCAATRPETDSGASHSTCRGSVEPSGGAVGETSNPLRENAEPPTEVANGIVLGRVSNIGPPLTIEFPDGRSIAAGICVMDRTTLAVGDIIAAVFDVGDREARPTVLGKVVSGLDWARVVDRVPNDGCVEIASESEVVLRCGKASITLTADGDVMIRGRNILSRASFDNRIRGAGVHIN